MPDTLQFSRSSPETPSDVNAESDPDEVRVWSADGAVRVCVARHESGKWVYVGGDLPPEPGWPLGVPLRQLARSAHRLRIRRTDPVNAPTPKNLCDTALNCGNMMNNAQCRSRVEMDET